MLFIKDLQDIRRENTFGPDVSTIFNVVNMIDCPGVRLQVSSRLPALHLDLRSCLPLKAIQVFMLLK